MTSSIKILGMAGSLRKASYNRALLRAATTQVPETATLEILDLDGIPLFNQDLENPPPEIVTTMKQKIEAADCILFVTPENNASVPAVLKNAIDWGSRPNGQNSWHGKPAGVIGATMGRLGTARAQCHLRQVLYSLGMITMNQPEVFVATVQNLVDGSNTLTDEATKNFLRKYLIALTDWAAKINAGKFA